MAKGVTTFPVPPAEPPTMGHTTTAQADSILSKKLYEAELMLAYAAETGKDLKPDVVVSILNAQDAYARGSLTIDLTKQFWSAFTKLCAVIKPVTGESLMACADQNLKQTVRRGRHLAIGLAFLILPVSILMFINTSMSNDISQRINDNNALAITLRDQLGAMTQPMVGRDQALQIKDIVVSLQQFTTTTRFLYRRAVLLNNFVLNSEQPDPFATQFSDETSRRKALELPVAMDGFEEVSKVRNDQLEKYQTIRAYSKDVQQLNLLFYGAVTAYLLPVLYALLGARAYSLRSLSQQLLTRTYTPTYADYARIPIAMIGGLVVALFTNFTQAISLPPLAIAFLVGYGVEIFFSFLDAFLETVKKVRN